MKPNLFRHSNFILLKWNRMYDALVNRYALDNTPLPCACNLCRIGRFSQTQKACLTDAAQSRDEKDEPNPRALIKLVPRIEGRTLRRSVSL
jgi:hypothetical protein